MKTIIKFFISVFLLIHSQVSSQVLNDIVVFNNFVSVTNNDLVNHFYGAHSLSAIPNNGITGGCLQTADTNDWGNDISTYCSKFAHLHDTTYYISLSFYYDSSLVLSGMQHPVSIWFRSHNYPSHSISASISNSKKMQIQSDSLFLESSVLPLVSGHWNEFTVTIFNLNAFPNELNMGLLTQDLGLLGTSPPVYLDLKYFYFIDTVMTLDSTIDISIAGSRNGGASYLDNFIFHGEKSIDSCISTSINSAIHLSDNLKINSQNGILIIEGDNISGKEWNVFDMRGKTILSSSFNADKNQYDISALTTGMYFLNIYNKTLKKSYRFTVFQ